MINLPPKLEFNAPLTLYPVWSKFSCFTLFISCFTAFTLSGANFLFFYLTSLIRGFTFKERQITEGEIPGISVANQANTSEFSLRKCPILSFCSVFNREPICVTRPSPLIYTSIVLSTGLGLGYFSFGSRLSKVIKDSSHSIVKTSLVITLSYSKTACLLNCKDWIGHCRVVAWLAFTYPISVEVGNLTVRQ